MSTIDVLVNEANLLRFQLEKVEECIAALRRTPPPVVENEKGSTNGSVRHTREYSRLTQREAILKALTHGPQTTRELFERLNAGGLHLKKATYVTALLPRMKDQVERRTDNKIQLRVGINSSTTMSANLSVKPATQQ